MISGATGALAVVMVALVADHGVEYLFITVVLMGLIQILAGVLRLGKFIRMVPHPVMLGFVNGLAIVIFLAQLGQFGEAGEPGWLSGTFMAGTIIDVAWIEGQQLYMLLGLVLLTMAIIRYLPKLTTAVPSSLVALSRRVRTAKPPLASNRSHHRVPGTLAWHPTINRSELR